MELRLGNSCGSCIHSNRPKQPREHAAHYEVAKTERWCFKHNSHITRETTCDDHEGISRAAKTAYTRIKTYNERLQAVREMVELMGDRRIVSSGRVYYVKDNWVKYIYGEDISKVDSNAYGQFEHTLRSKDSSTARYLKAIKEKL
jgi:hypothetical protein